MTKPDPPCDAAEFSHGPEQCVRDDPVDRILEALCPRCGHAVDAVCPDCGANVESGGSEPKGTVLSRAEYYRRLLLMLQGARNTKFMLCCYFIATGDALAEGTSMVRLSEEWKVTKAQVSKQCRFICQYLGVPPSRYMRDEQAATTFRMKNRRPRKL